MAELTTLALVRSYLGDPTADATLTQAAIDAAEDRIARECGRFDEAAGAHWLSASRTEYLDGEWSKDVLLTFTPITAVATVSVIESATASTTVALTDLECDGLPISGLAAGTPGRAGRLGYRRYAEPSVAAFAQGYDPFYPRFPGGSQRVKVTYTGGYATAPKALAQAAMVYAAQLCRDAARDSSIKSESLGDYSVTFADAAGAADLPPAVSSLIRNYKRLVV